MDVFRSNTHSEPLKKSETHTVKEAHFSFPGEEVEKLDTHVVWRYPGISVHPRESLPPLTGCNLRLKSISVLVFPPKKSFVAARKITCGSMVGWGGGRHCE